MLKDTPLEPSFPFYALAERAAGLSGSDLRELCRNAAMVPVREYVRETGENHELLQRGQLEVRLIISVLLISRTFEYDHGNLTASTGIQTAAALDTGFLPDRF